LSFLYFLSCVSFVFRSSFYLFFYFLYSFLITIVNKVDRLSITVPRVIDSHGMNYEGGMGVEVGRGGRGVERGGGKKGVMGYDIGPPR
jgi:hypothetical protein